ncbi:MAG: two pore domain potassium channel family protein [Chloroflexi bacterium]|nr:two pore domain potassium channel family protein [Chloroflexota bacterium]
MRQPSMRTTFAFNFQRLLTAPLLILTRVAVGTMGVVWIARADWLTALYMTIITISTIGYGEIKPLSTDNTFAKLIFPCSRGITRMQFSG